MDILPNLLERVWIPPSVQGELSHTSAPPAVRAWIFEPRPWLEIVAARAAVDDSLNYLDRGERDAVALAVQENASVLLIGERDRVAAAQSLGLRTLGTLGVLDAAAARGWVRLPTIFQRLGNTSFRLPHRLMATLLAEDAARNRR